jgi:ribosomal protein S19
MRKLHKRNTIIKNSDVKKSFLIHQGSSFFKVTVSNEMVGSKFGEYVFTRRLFKYQK